MPIRVEVAVAQDRRIKTSLKSPPFSSQSDARHVTVRVHAYGACSVEVAGNRLGKNADVVVSLIILLTHAPGMQMSRDTVLALLWPNSPDKHQRGNLRQALYKLRQMGVHAALNGDQIELDGSQLEPTFSMRRDAQSFDSQVVQGHEPFGPFLPGFDLGASPLLVDWIENERERAHGDARRVLAQALRARHAVADWVAAEPLARWLLQFDPLNEAATLVMAECLVLSGAKYEAIRLLDRYMNELGPTAGDLRIPATTLRRRIAAPAPRRISFAPTERHFIGRESAMADLTLCMRRARHHDGTATLLHGPAGMGKTRVLNELAKVAMIEGVRDVRAGCRETDVNRPLSIFLDLVPELLQMPGALGCSPENLYALRRFTNDDTITVERSGASVPLSLPLAAGLRRSIVDLLGAVSEEKPLVLSVEDVHWLDAGSWEVLVDLIDRIGKMRVCLIMTSRLPHARPMSPERAPIALSIRVLEPLSSESSLQLAHAIGTDLSASIDEELGQWFVHTGEGVPLFLRSLVNHWIETGDAGGIPPTLLGVIGQRVQSLSSDALYVLQTVALLGRHADLAMIECVLELPYFRIVSAIDDLHKAGAFDGDHDGIVVCHELIGRMAVDSLGRNARRALHKRIADIMKASEAAVGIAPVLCRDRLGHLLQSGDTKLYLAGAIEAIRGLLDAGYSYDALGVCGLALEHASEPDARSQILKLQSEALYCCGEYSKLLRHTLSPASIDVGLRRMDREEPEVLLRWIDSAAYADTGANASDLCAAAIMVAESNKNSNSIRFSAATLSIRIATNTCDRDHAVRAYEIGRQATEEMECPIEKVAELDMLFHTSFGDRSTGTKAAKILLALSTSMHNVTERLSLQLRIAYALRYGGLVNEAQQLLEAIHAESIVEHLSSTFSFASWRLSNLYLDSGKLTEAKEWFVVFSKLTPSAREPLAAMLLHTHAARLAIASSDPHAAQIYISRAMECMPERGHAMRHSYSLACTLAISRMLGDLAGLEQTIKIALPVHIKSRNSVGQAFFASELALALYELGRPSEAVTYLDEYMTIYKREPPPIPVYLEETVKKLNCVARTP